MTEPFPTFTSKIVPLPAENVDTDQIVPARYLKVTDKGGLAEALFRDWRYEEDGSLREPRFVLDRPGMAGRQILLVGDNFGAGSSREHAPWALLDYGFRAIIASSFADIFANNCTKNGILPVVLKETEVAQLIRRASQEENYALTVDLENKRVTDSNGFTATFQMDDFKRKFLLEGLDDIGLTLKHEAEIRAFENRPGRFGYNQTVLPQ